MIDTTCHICKAPMDSHGYADTCDRCAADPAAAYADIAAAEESQCTEAAHSEIWG